VSRSDMLLPEEDTRNQGVTDHILIYCLCHQTGRCGTELWQPGCSGDYSQSPPARVVRCSDGEGF